MADVIRPRRFLPNGPSTQPKGTVAFGCSRCETVIYWVTPAQLQTFPTEYVCGYCTRATAATLGVAGDPSLLPTPPTRATRRRDSKATKTAAKAKKETRRGR